MKNLSFLKGLAVGYKVLLVFIVLLGAFVPWGGVFEWPTFFFIPYGALIIYFLYKAITYKKRKEKKRKESFLWYIFILVILFTPFRSIIQPNRIEAYKDFAVDLQNNCIKFSDCSIKESNLPWTNGRVQRFNITKDMFYISHWHYQTAHDFSGGISDELVLTISDEDNPIFRKTFRYLDNKWVLKND